MKCSKCNNMAVAESYCKKHYIEAKEKVYTNNCDKDNLGIVKWLEDFFPEYTPQRTPEFHKEFYSLLLSLYSPQYRNRYDRQRLFKSYRGSGKSSSATFGFPIYVMAHNGQTIKIKVPVASIQPDGETLVEEKVVDVVLNEKLIVIVSKTGLMAEEFAVRIRDEIATNEMFRYFYGSDIRDALDAIDGQWTKKAFKFNGCYLIGLGTGMQIRGRIKGAARATLIIFDDIYDENNVGEAERKKVRTWFNGAALNSLDDLNGKAVLIGTILHQDTVMIDCEKDRRWKHVSFTPMPVENMKKLINEYLKPDYDNRRCILPYDEIENDTMRMSKQMQYFDKLQKEYDWKLAWKERQDLYFMAVKFQSAVQNGTIALFWQEYFHITIPEEKKRFLVQHFKKVKEWRLFEEFGYLWFQSDLHEQPMLINIELGVDIGGGSIDGDNTAIVPVGQLSDSKIIVFPAIYGKMEIRDVVEGSPARDAQVEMDRSKILKIGFADELFRASLRYKPSLIKFGIAGEEKLHIPNVERLFRMNNSYLNIVPRVQMAREGRKHERITNTCLPYYQAGMVYHCSGNDLLELELENLTSYTSDDIADALEVAMWQIQHPGELTYEYFTSFKQPKRRGLYYPREYMDGIEETIDWISKN